jgi:hypothetical protein
MIIGGAMFVSDIDYAIPGLLLNICAVAIFIIGLLSITNVGMIYLWEHVDDDKTCITKVNGDVSEMYITIDGKEYHFEFPLKEETT